MTPTEFRGAIAGPTATLAGRRLDADLDRWLDTEHGPGSGTFQRLRQGCEAGVAAGWLCDREGGGIRCGRVFEPALGVHGFSVDVVGALVLYLLPDGRIDFIR